MSKVFSKSLVLNVEGLTDTPRMDVWLSQQDIQLSRQKIQKAITSGHIILNEKPCKRRELLKNGDLIQIQIPVEKVAYEIGESCHESLEILYEDEWILVINKTPGVSIHEGAGIQEKHTLVEMLRSYFRDSEFFQRSAEGFNIRPGIVHRLDKDTSGVMIIAKDDNTHRNLSEQFAERRTKKHYVALLSGDLSEPRIVVDNLLNRDPRNRLKFRATSLEVLVNRFGGKEHIPKYYRRAVSIFKKKSSYAHRLTLADIEIKTGRTHQIRVHSEFIKNPVMGDPLYKIQRQLSEIFPKPVREKLNALTRQLLHANSISFNHPDSGLEVTFVANLPSDFQQIIQMLEPFRIDEK